VYTQFITGGARTSLISILVCEKTQCLRAVRGVCCIYQWVLCAPQDSNPACDCQLAGESGRPTLAAVAVQLQCQCKAARSVVQLGCWLLSLWQGARWAICRRFRRCVGLCCGRRGRADSQSCVVLCCVVLWCGVVWCGVVWYVCVAGARAQDNEVVLPASQ
jgi:hypothetical protein